MGTSTINVGANPQDLIAALANIKKAGDFASLLQSTPALITDLAKQATDALTITQQEMDSRAAFEATVNQAKADLVEIQGQKTLLNQIMADTKSQADSDNLVARNASDAYVKANSDAIQKRLEALDTYKKELDAREIEVSDRETAVTQAEKVNTALKNSLDTRQEELVKFSNSLRLIVPSAPILELTTE